MLKRRIFYYVVASVLWLALGITNGVILGFRMTPFTVSDLALLENGLSILTNYMKVAIVLLALGILAVITLFVITFILYRKQKVIPYKTNLLLIIAVCLIFASTTNMGLEKRWLSRYFPNLGYAYQDYGFLIVSSIPGSFAAFPLPRLFCSHG